jgi:hypothetical protein
VSTGVPWPPLLMATRSVLAWPALAWSAAAALGVAALGAVLPPAGAAQLPGLAVLVLGCGMGAAADDRTAVLTAATPVTIRRRLVARAVLAVPVSAAAAAGVVLLAAAGGADPDWGLVRSWGLLSALALAAGAAGSRRGLPGVLPATVLLGTGMVLQTTLPEPVRQAWPWNSAAERVVVGLLLAAGLIVWATRDPGGRRRAGRGMP